MYHPPTFTFASWFTSAQSNVHFGGQANITGLNKGEKLDVV